MTERKIQRLLVANRGEIAIRIFRAGSELKIRTVAIYTHEDRYSLHRYKADEAYQIGKEHDPLKPYLDVEAIIQLAKDKKIDAIHPGYGFLSENVRFARRCREEGILFVGPSPEAMEKLGDKVAAKKIARESEVPVIEDSLVDLQDAELALAEAERIGFPVMLKAASGGGGRGMRVVREASELKKSFKEASNEALKAFGEGTVFIEKYIENPKHIEVQVLGDQHGNIVHLYERDCSVQRRFQKVVEVAPSPTLSQATKDKLYAYALKIAHHVGYYNAGTVEFLVDKEENVYFIEVNPRIQVEHTITEEITGIDIVRSQLLIAQGHPLSFPGIYLSSQEDVKVNGFAIQCRVTTEDPTNNFQPDFGTIIAYRNAAGMGIRLDEGSSYSGVTISPFFDSMLVKVSSWGRTLRGAAERLDRALSEFRIRGVKTNIPFLQNVVKHPIFVRGEQTVSFIQDHPELLEFPKGKDRATKLLRYLSDVIINGNPDVKTIQEDKVFRSPVVPDFDPYSPFPKGTKDLLTALGPDGFSQWVKEQRPILYTDTTFRDAHQSLLATRMRTTDMLAIAESYARHHPELFSVELWGGATFDVCMRFLKEDPWERLRKLRAAMPNILTQMLFRSSNAVGYTSYPDNLVERFIEEAAGNGMDVFRIFDSLNWTENMEISIRAVRERTQSLAEACICYTGDISNPEKTKFTLDYYIEVAKKLEDMGAHILCIKDMAGLLKPYAAAELIDSLKQHVQLPIHLHTHDTSSIQSATYLKAIEAGVDIVDVAISSMSGLTSQPNFNSLVAMMQGHEREQKIDLGSLNRFANYWEDVRELYYPFESELKAGTAQVYENEIPGGQYSNLRPQARGLGIEHKFETIKENYRVANMLLGDIVKVTPSSKVVGDLALFMTSNGYTAQDLLSRGESLSFPDSVINFLKGDLGQPYGGFPRDFQKIVLKEVQPYTHRPNELLEPIDFERELPAFQEKFGKEKGICDFLSYSLYPKVYQEFHSFCENYGNVLPLPSKAFFYGMKQNEEIVFEISPGKKIIVKYLNVTAPDAEGKRYAFFKLNGQNRQIQVQDQQVLVETVKHEKVAKEGDVGSPLQGKLTQILVNRGDQVEKNDPLFLIEAMKMESTVVAPFAGTIEEIMLRENTMVQQDDLVLRLK
ncbi:pyruvate carboxylase [Nitritalea halalkaliphila LW7]|uniref:Pyruvate carboxylase n=1 Tax=Nitritalea halalkaliphila LW7 TaxID=1189621 RepID=I5C2G4_9BACT|nr:pyruvate carboxylase [Nitritalea halalkaliphila]EIM76016.1 pyruvate carboxylase [Nitritalea halalkaliphila LW7]